MFFRDLPSVEIQKRQIIDGGGKNNTFHLDVVSKKNTAYIPRPVFFFVPSQLESSPLEPSPPVLIPPLPPVARSKLDIKSLGTVIASQSCRVREAVRSIMNSDEISAHDTLSNR